MENVVTHPVTGLPPAERQALERLLGGSLDDGQEVVIMAITPGEVHSEEEQRQAHAEVLQTMDEIRAYQQAAGITQEETDAIADEAIAAVRQRRKQR